MNIGIVSDSHGDIESLKAMLQYPEAAQAEMWLHAGDYAADADALEQLTGKSVVRVLGNCDLPLDGTYGETVVEAGGHRIFLTHGHLFHVRFDTAILAAAAREAGADIAVYGHTHIALYERQGDVTVFNPGSVARPRDAVQGSFMMINLTAGEEPKMNLIRFK